MNSLTDLKINKSQTDKLAKNLQVLLKERRVSESDIAHSVDMPVMTVRRIVSGETSDPRISTLKLFADYFNVPIDYLIGEINTKFISMTKNMPKFIPVLDWKTASKIKSVHELDLKSWNQWHTITLDHFSLSDDAFAIESRPSMYHRFPLGTLFIVEPNEIAADGDIVLVKTKENNDLSLRELIVDSPKWQLQPIVIGSESLFYNENEHLIAGVIILTMLYARRDK